MCSECRQSPCHPQCPNNDEEPEPVYNCELCNAGIFPYDIWYDINDMVVCEDCVEEMKRRA